MRTRRVILGIVSAALTAGAAAQPETVDALLTSLGSNERQAADRSLSTREREQAADRAIEARRKLIAQAQAGDARLTAWLVDQSAAVLARLGRDGSDSAVLFGIPLPAQRETVLVAAREAAADLDRAATRADEASRALAASGVPPEDPRAAGVEQERTVRIPFYKARALVLLAACASGAERARQAEAAYQSVIKLALANPGPEASRRVSLAAAALMRKSPPDDADVQTALDELSGVVRNEGKPDAAVPAITRAEAWCGLVQAGVAGGKSAQAEAGLKLALKQEPFVGSDGRADALLAVLAADALTRALWERGERQRDRALLDQAVAAQTELLNREDLGVRAESLRPLSFEKLAQLAASADPSLPMPPAVRLARAISLSRDPARAADAIATYKAVADAPDSGEFAADALWEWAVLLTQSPGAAAADRLEAARILTRLARDFPASAHAIDAMNAALAYARAGEAAGGAGARAAYAAALAVATASYGKLPDIDLWRYERARVLADPTQAQPGIDDLLTAIALLDAVAAGSAVAGDAVRLEERTREAVLDRYAAKLADLRKAGDADGLRRFAAETVVPEARRATEWARIRDPVQLGRFELDLAEAMLDAGDAGALALFKRLQAQEATLPGGAPRVRLGLGRAEMLAGSTAGAFAALREAATRLDAAPASGSGPARVDAFWHAWTLMLELLQAQNADGTRSGTIRAQIKRLEAIDAELGGDPWKGRIGKIRETLGG